MLDTIKAAIPPINKEGYPFIGIFAIVTLLAFAIWSVLGWIGVGLTIWCVLFFRDPERVSPTDENAVVSPADGVVCLIDEVMAPAELDMGEVPLKRVCVFMNVFNCHVNRTPMAGTIDRIEYRPGKFLNASFDKASSENERNAYRLTTAKGVQIGFVQIAGLVARRIVWHVTEGQQMQAGERFGLIRFGSRVDVYMPLDADVAVELGQTMIAGETILGRLKG